MVYTHTRVPGALLNLLLYSSLKHYLVNTWRGIRPDVGEHLISFTALLCFKTELSAFTDLVRHAALSQCDTGHSDKVNKHTLTGLLWGSFLRLATSAATLLHF